MRPGGVADRVACAAATRPPPRARFAALPERIMTLLNDSGSTFDLLRGTSALPSEARALATTGCSAPGSPHPIGETALASLGNATAPYDKANSLPGDPG